MNLSFSKKDRVAPGMIEAAERSGARREGVPVLSEFTDDAKYASITRLLL